MSAHNACLNDAQFQALLAGAASELERLECEAHLTDCVRCREQLDALAGGQMPRRGKKSPPAAAPDSRPLREAMARLKAGTETAPADLETVTSLPGAKFRYLGDYEILEELGRGGMGVVYKARQASLRREVALKVMLAGQLASPAEVRRFHVEAEAAARLDHPHIVPIFEIGEHEGHHFFSMKFVEGGTLSGRISQDQPQIPPGEAAKLLATVARAVHYAHQRGVLHRDLKPGNILLDHANEAHVTDFGLAKLVEHDSSLTRSAAVMGTPNYMAPETAAGRAREATTAADVYSLGTILYELLTGWPPFQADSPAQTLRLVLESDPVSPAMKNPSVPSDLATICLKCLEKDPARRYASAGLLAEELDRFGRGEPILARPTSLSERTWRWCRRKPALASLIAAVAVLLITVAVGSPIAAWKIQRERQQVQRHAEAETRQRQRTEALLTRAEIQRAERLFEVEDSAGALAQLARVVRQNPTDQLAATRLFTALTWRSYPLPATGLLEHKGSVRYAQFSPNGRRVVTASDDDSARIWHAITGQAVTEWLKHGGDVQSVQLSPDGLSFVTASRDKTARVWNATNGLPITEPLQHGDRVWTALFSPDGQQVVTASQDGTARIWNSRTGQPFRKFTVSGACYQAEFRPDGKRILTGNSDGTAQIWNVETGEMVVRLPSHKRGLWAARFSPDGNAVVTASSDGTARIWDANTGAPRTEPLRHEDLVTAAAFAPDGQRVATASWDKTARIWDARTGLPVGAPLRHEGQLEWVCFSGDGKRVLTSSYDRTARIWDATTGRPVGEPLRHKGYVWSAEFSPDGTRVVTASRDHTAAIWDVRPGWALNRGFQHNGPVNSAQFNSNGTQVITASDDKTVNLLDVATMKPRRKPISLPQPVSYAAFSPDGRYTVIVFGRHAHIQDATTGQVFSERPIHDQDILSVQFSPDSRWLATGSKDGTARLWQVPGGTSVGEPLRHTGRIVTIQFSPDSRRVVTASHDHAARVWDVPTGKPLGRALRHDSEVQSAQFSPKGDRVVTGCMECTVHIWDAQTGEPLTKPLHHGSSIRAAEFSSDGQRILTASRVKLAQIWDAATGEPLGEPLTHATELLSARFSPDGLRIATITADYRVHIWDASRGLQIVEPFQHDGEIASLTFSPDGRYVLTASADRSVRLWEIPELPLPVPVWVTDLAEALAGQRFNAEGAPQSMPLSELLRLKRELLKIEAVDFYHDWARWFFADRGTRPAAPASFRSPSNAAPMSH